MNRIEHRRWYSSFAIAAACGIAACGPATTLATRGPYAPGSAPTEGFRYYLPRDVITIDARVTTRTARRWETFDGNKCVPSALKRAWLQTSWTTSISTVADPVSVFRLGAVPKGRVEQTLKVTVTEDGLLAALNYSSKDQTAEIAGSVLKGVAGLAGEILGISTATATNASSPRGGLRMNVDLGVKADPTRKHALTDGFCWAITVPEGQALLEQEQMAEDALALAQADRAAKLAKSKDATNESDARKYAVIDDLQVRRISAATAVLEVVRAALAAGAGASGYAVKAGVGKTDTTIRHLVTLDLARVPALVGRITVADAKAAANSQTYADFIDSTHVFVTVTDLPNSSATLGTPSKDLRSLGCNEGDNPDDDDCTRVYYRAPTPRVVSVYVADGVAPTAPMRLRESAIANLVSSADKTLHIAFAPKAMGEAGTGLTFGRRGTVTGIEQTSKASLASASANFATALSTARAEFTAGLSAVQTTQTSLESIRQANRSAQIRALQDQKALIDAEVAVQGTSANRDLVFQRSQLDAQLGLLQSQQQLETALIRGETNAAVAELKAQIDQLAAQLELLKKQLELETLKRASETKSPL